MRWRDSYGKLTGAGGIELTLHNAVSNADTCRREAHIARYDQEEGRLDMKLTKLWIAMLATLNPTGPPRPPRCDYPSHLLPRCILLYIKNAMLFDASTTTLC